VLWWFAVAGITAILVRSQEGPAQWGMQRRGQLRPAWVVVAAGMVLGCAVLVAARLHTLHAPTSHFSWLAYLLWSIVQQFLMQALFLARLQRLIRGERAAALAAAGLFAVAHLPNPLLAIATLPWGFVACLLFQRYRSLYAIGVAHGILGITIALTIPGTVSHNMRAGLGYLTYVPPHSTPPRTPAPSVQP
jgi:membrane protease YdiL (CAAX protease family)